MNKSLRSALLYLWLLVITALSCYYLYRAVDYRFLHADRLGPTFFNKQLWYFSHVLLALPVVFGVPLQFLPKLRKAAPHFHRWIGRTYVLGASGRGCARNISRRYDRIPRLAPFYRHNGRTLAVLYFGRLASRRCEELRITSGLRDPQLHAGLSSCVAPTDVRPAGLLVLLCK